MSAKFDPVGVEFSHVYVIDKNEDFSFLEKDAGAVMVRNTGNVPAKVNRNWTFDPGDSFAGGSQNDVNLIVGTLSFRFSATGITDPNPRIEIFIIKTRFC